MDELKKMLEEIQKAVESGKADSDKHKEEIKALQDAIKTLEDKKVKRSMGVIVPGVDEEKETFSFFKAIKAMRSGDWSDAGFEKECFDTTKKTALASGTDSLGGYLVPAQFVAQIIELLRAETVLDKIGMTVIPNLTGSPVEFPTQEGGATTFWIGENSPITESNQTFGTRSMQPKKLAALVKISNSLLRLNNTSAEAVVRADIAKVMALRLDLAGLRGTGGPQPTGITNTTGINTFDIATNGGRFDFQQAEKMVEALDTANALRGKLGFVMHPKIKSIMKKERIAQFSGQTEGAYVVLPMSDQLLQDSLGWPFASTTQIPINLTQGSGTDLSEVYFANWAELILGMWGGMELLASNVAGDNNGGAMTSDQTWIRAIMEADFMIRHPESFAVVNDADTDL